DFAINAFHRVIAAVRTAHDDVQRAADAQVDLADRIGEVLGPPPFRQLPWIGPCLEHGLTRRIDEPRELDVAFQFWVCICHDVSPCASRHPAAGHRRGERSCQWFSTLIIQGMPKRSLTMPNFADQKVCCRGMVTFPPSESSLKMRSASAALSTVSDTCQPCGCL